MTNDIENHMVLPVADPESEPEARLEPDEDETRQQECDDRRGSLDARLGMAIRHIVDHSYFDKPDLIQLLKDVQKERTEMRDRFDEINIGLTKLLETPLIKRQA